MLSLAACAVILGVPPPPPRFDADGIPLPPEAVRRLGSARFRHAGQVLDIAVAADGRTVYSADEHGRHLYAWDAATGRPVYRVPLLSYAGTVFLRLVGPVVRAETYSEDWRYAAFHFDAATGRRLDPPPYPDVRLNGWATLTADGRHFLRVHEDVVRRYGIDESEFLLHVYPTAPPLAPPRTLLKQRQKFELVVSPDGRRVAVLTPFALVQDSTLVVYDVTTGTRIRGWQFDGVLRLPAFTPEGDAVAGWLLSSCARGVNTLTAFDPRTGGRRTLLRTNPRTDPGVGDYWGFTPNGVAAVCSQWGGGLTVLRAGYRSPVLPRWFESGFQPTAFSPDGERVYVASGSEVIAAFDAATVTRLVAADAADRVAIRHFAADGRVATAECRGEVWREVIWDVPTGTRRDYARVAKPHWRPLRPSYSPDGRMEIHLGEPPLRLIERETGQTRHVFHGHIGKIDGLAFSPDGRHLAVASPDAPIFIWDVRGELSKPVGPPDLPAAWAALAREDAPAAFRAVRLLAHFPEQAVPFLRAKLPPAAGPTAAELAALVAALDAPAFAEREAAEAKLRAIGRPAADGLRAAVVANPSAELKARADRLLAAVGKLTAEHLRAARAVEAVGWMTTPAAKALLADWAGGAAGAWLTTEARR